MPPLQYSPEVEQPAPDEADTTAQLTEQMLKIARTTLVDEKESLRAVHAKGHGLLKAVLTVPEGLPPALAQGLFARPGRHDAALRFSTSPGDLLPDSVSTPRGLAIKVFGVEGERLPGSEDAATQDFLLVTGKAFNAPDPKHFLKTLKLLAATTDKGEGLKVALAAVLRGAESALETVGGQSVTLKSLGGYPAIHILGESFFTQVPLRFGDHIAKLGVVPVSPELVALKDAPLDLDDGFDPLRQAVRTFFAASGGAWEIRAQLCTNLADMPVEDASMPWPEKDSPYVTVARLEAEPQESWSDARVQSVDKAMSFSPWHGIAAHRPLGGVMRARKVVYDALARFRLSHNRCPIHQAQGIT